MSELTDDVIKAAASGDVSAFELIYKTYSRFVYNVAYRMVSTIEDAKEVTQEVFITIYRKLSMFKFESAFKTWIYRITVNTSINYLKKMNKSRTVEFDDQYEYTQSENEAVNHMNKEENTNIINQLLNALNPDQRACMVLRNIEGLSYEEIANSLNININTVRSRLKRAREKLLKIKDEVIKNEV